MQTILGIIAVVLVALVAIKLLIVVGHLALWLIAVFGSVIWIAALVHIAFSQFSNVGTKVFWFVVVLFTHVFGAIAYFLFGRPRGVVRTYI